MTVSYDFRGQVAVVTGGARGIGRAIVERLARDGATTAVWDLDPDLFDNSRAGARPDLLERVDVSDAQSVSGAVERTLAALGSIHIVVNNAGIVGPYTPTWDLEPNLWQRVLDINLNGVFNTCRAVTPLLTAQRYGRIINMASMAGKEGNALQSAYSASKAGVIALTKTLGKELATTGVTVNAMAPALAPTELFADVDPEHIATGTAKIPMARPVTPEEIADLAAWIASDECSFTTGFTFDISGGRATY